MITAMPRIAIAAEDFDGILDTFKTTFGMPVIDISAETVHSLGAKLAMCVPPGGSNIELMSPADPEAPLSQSLQRFLDRRGDGLFALMLEAPVPDDEAEVLIQNGLQVLPLMAGAAGRDIHPNSTHGVLIRVYPNESFQAEPPSTEDDMQLSGIMKVIIAVDDIEAAMNVYGDGLGLSIDAIREDKGRGVRSTLVRPPKGGEIELVQPLDSDGEVANRIRTFLDERGEGMYALVLQSPNLNRTSEVLKARGSRVTELPDAVEVKRDDTYGALIRIEQLP